MSLELSRDFEFLPPDSALAHPTNRAEYEASLSHLAGVYDSAAAVVVADHEMRVTTYNSREGSKADFVNTIRKVQGAVNNLTVSYPASVESIIKEASAHDGSARNDWDVWSKLKHEVARSRGFAWSYHLVDICSGASSPIATEAMRISLDRSLYETTLSERRDSPVGLNGVKWIRTGVSAGTIQRASGPWSELALRATFDDDVWGMLQARDVDPSGRTHKGFLGLLGLVSTVPVADKFVYLLNNGKPLALKEVEEELNPYYAEHYRGYRTVEKDLRSHNAPRQRFSADSQDSDEQPPEVDENDPRIPYLRGGDRSTPTSAFVNLLANLDRFRRKGETDAEIYKRLVRHYHPDLQHGKSPKQLMTAEVMTRVVTTSYNPKNKSFKA